MESADVYDGSSAAFEGDTTLLVRSLPAGARIKRATLTVAPVAPPGGTLFQERLDFAAPADASRTLGATKLADGATFVEVDFHTRRTLAAVTGTNVDNTALQVDLGGVYVEINANGAIRTPTDPAAFALTGGRLPGLTVGKFKLTSANAGQAPDLSTVTIRSTPANLTARLGKTAAFWTHPGELASAVTSTDFAPLLQTFLGTARVENGYYLVPIVLHSEGLARLRLELNVSYLYAVDPTPNAVGEAVFAYDAGTVSGAPAQLAVALPPDARVVAGDTAVRVAGQFASTRIVEGYGAPTGAVTIAGSAAVTPAGSVAQIVAFASPVSATAVDLSLTGVSRTARLALDVRADLDGKPDGTSLLGGPVPFAFQSLAAPAPGWVTVALPKEFHFASAGPARYWLVVQSLDGDVAWNLGPLPSLLANANPPAAPVQQSAANGLSWRNAVTAGADGARAAPLGALYRLRYQPAQYQVPIEVRIGSGERAARVKLDRYQPLNRVDFTLDAPELAGGFNAYLDGAVPAACTQAEHVANGDFRQWLVLAGELGRPRALAFVTSTGTVAVAPDGRSAYAGATDTPGPRLAVIDAQLDTPAGAPIPVPGRSDPVFCAPSPDGTRLYLATGAAVHVVDVGARADLGTAATRGLDAPTGGALAPDGSMLYVAAAATVQAYATAALDDAVRTGAGVTPSAAAPLSGAASLAISPDGAVLYAADNPAGGGRLRALATPGLAPESTLALGVELGALAVTPDGARLTVLDAGAGTPVAWVVETAPLRVAGSIALPAGAPRAVVVTPDGGRAYVASRSGTDPLTISTLDLARFTVTGKPVTVPAGPAVSQTPPAGPVSLALTPAGDRLYVADGVRQTLASVPAGTPVPADWSPSGQVQPARIRGAAPIVVLGNPDADTGGASAGLSQVVPVLGGCPYVFSFAAEASLAHSAQNLAPDALTIPTSTAAGAPDATAEVSWLTGACGLERTDSVAIAAARGGALPPYRLAVTAPAGASQAEIRFRTAPGSVLALSTVSLAGSAGALINGDLSRIGGDGTPSSWTATAPAARVGVTADPAGGPTRLRNAGAQPAELAQTVAVSKSPLLEVEIAARASGPAPGPSLAIAFTAADGSALGSAAELALGPADFERHPAQLSVPSGAARVTVRLRLPPGSALEVRKIALRFADAVNVPIAFIAQAPGELRVSRAAVAYERVPLPAPPVPASGLCTPTPPDGAPGSGAGGDGCHCMQCNAARPTHGAVATTTPAGRPMTVATCADCGAQTVRLGGVPAVAAMAEMALALPSITLADTARTMMESAAAAPQPVTVLAGIGPARAKALAAVGITTVEKLAVADAVAVARVLRGVTPANADVLIKHAQKIAAIANQ